MLEKIDSSKKLSKKEAKAYWEAEAEKLSLLQRECKAAGIPVLIVFEGVGASGKGYQINELIHALDPRGFLVYSTKEENEDESMHPFLWRFWQRTPTKGRISIFDRGWYYKVMVERYNKQASPEVIHRAFSDINAFERQLIADGACILKFFLHIDKKEQKKRFEALRKNEATAWRVTDSDLKRLKDFDSYRAMNEEMLMATDTAICPWTIVEAEDAHYGKCKIIHTVTERLQKALDDKKKKDALKEEAKKPKEEKAEEKKSASKSKKAEKTAPQAEAQVENKAEADVENLFDLGALSKVDLTKSLSEKEYKKRKDELQERLRSLHQEIYKERIPVVIAFEGWDAGGKGGAIKRLTSHLDPRGYAVHPTAAPNDIEKAHHYLWRFWVNMPKDGHIAIFDRSWYGRVMVERIEGFAAEEEWKRAYREINEMEEQLKNSGALILKFWMQIDKDEQKKRFDERMNTPEKRWKITDEDWRNREKWDAYELAVNEMLVRTSTEHAPWIIVEGNDKKYARVKVLQTVVDAIEKKLEERKKEKHSDEKKRRML